MRRFGIIWFGQLVSLIGTGMTRFALLVAVHRQEGTATSIALVGFASFVPYVLVSPFAGVWVDRLDRKTVMLAADLAAGCSTLGLLLAAGAGDPALWQIYTVTAVAGAAEAFQVPAFTAVTTLLVPKSQYMRASGMRSLAESAGQVAAPAFAGVVLLVTDLRGVLLVDLATFLVAVALLIPVRVPARSSVVGPGERPALRREVGEAVAFIRSRAGLPTLLAVFAAINLFAALTYFAILPVLVLARTDDDSSSLAAVQAALGIGGVLGGLVLGVWGGPARRIHAVLGGAALSFAIGDTLLAVGRSTGLWVLAAVLASAFVPFVVGADQAIWQAKTPIDLQGRVFALRGMIRLAMVPIGYAAAGPLADSVFEPAMRPGGALSELFGPLVGTGPGAGIGLMFLATAVLGTLASLAGYLSPTVRHIDQRLPDHDDEPATR